MIASALRVLCPECHRERTEFFTMVPVHGEKTVLFYFVDATEIEHSLYMKPCACGCYDLRLVFTSEVAP